MRPFVGEMRVRLSEALKPFLSGKVAYVHPLQTNTGDWLIQAASVDALKGARIVSSTPWTVPPDIDADTVMVQGGGNLGDRYRPYASAWIKVVEDNPRRKVVILPQTVFWGSQEIMDGDLASLRRHPRLTVMAREERSMEILRGRLRDIRLVPDLAFALDGLEISPSPSGPVVEISRADREGLPDRSSGTDWGGTRNVQQALDMARRRLGGASLVLSDRLHVHIVCSIAGIQNILVANAYHKNLSFFDTWTYRDGVSRFAASWAEARKMVGL